MADNRKKRGKKADLAGDVAVGVGTEGGCCLVSALFSALALVGIAGLPLLLMR